MKTTRRPLDVLEVEDPCTADWDAMHGDDRVRFCGHCQRNVHNLSAMTEDDAIRLVCEEAGELCVRFLRDAKGRTATLNYQSAADGAKRGWRFWSVLGVGGAIASWLISAVAGIPGRKPARGGPIQGGIQCLTIYITPTTLPTTVPVGTPATNPSDDVEIGAPQ